MALKIAPNFIAGIWGQNCKGMLGMIHAPGRYKPTQPHIIRNL
jgi:Mg2+ and Co2+ transporter CorA